MMRTASRKRHQATSFILAAILLCALSLLMLLANMGKELSHDEHMYVTSGYLLGQHALIPYRDYPYLQMPYLSLVYAPLFHLTGHLLLAARLFSTLCAALLIAAFFRVAYHTRGATWTWLLIGLGGAILLITNPIFIYASGLAWNHDLPVLLAALTLVVYGHALRQENARRWMIAAGALLGLTIGTRLIFLLLILPFLLALLFYPGLRLRQSRLALLLNFLLGTSLALVPALLVFALSPGRFLWGNIGYHQLNELYRRQAGHTQMMALDTKLAYLRDVFTETNTLLLLLLFVALILAHVTTTRTHPDRRIEPLLAAILLPFIMLGALVPTPTWYQYYYAAIPFLILGALYSLAGYTTRSRLDWRLILFTLVALASSISGFPRYVRPDLLAPDTWVTVKAHQLGQQIRRAAPTGKVLTLAPVFPLEGGLSIYTQFAAGPFTWRAAPLMAESDRNRLDVISPRELDDLLRADPPSAILVGYEPDLEAPLTRYAQDHSFTLTTLPDGKTLWTPAP